MFLPNRKKNLIMTLDPVWYIPRRSPSPVEDYNTHTRHLWYSQDYNFKRIQIVIYSIIVVKYQLYNREQFKLAHHFNRKIYKNNLCLHPRLELWLTKKKHKNLVSKWYQPFHRMWYLIPYYPDANREWYFCFI